VSTGGGRKNRAYLEPHLRLEGRIPAGRQAVMFDPQTSGGLLISIEPEQTSRLLDALAEEGVAVRALVGKISETAGVIRVSG
jgi:selenide,water dikinase